MRMRSAQQHPLGGAPGDPRVAAGGEPVADRRGEEPERGEQQGLLVPLA